MKRLQSARQTTVTEVRTLAADPYITKRYTNKGSVPDE